MAQDFEELFEFNKEKFLSRPLFYKGESDGELLEDIKNSRIAIYTAFTGEYDNLKDPEYIDENCDYICFTNNPNAKSEIWKIMPMEESNLDDNRIAKQYKVLPHKYLKDYKYSFWIDSSFKIVGSIREYVSEFIRNPMLNVLNDDRDCVYDEFLISAAISRYSTAILIKQIEKYEKEGFPSHYGLPSAGIMFRQHNNPAVIKVMEDWWSEIINYTNQDQISFSYACWKNNFHPSVSSVFVWSNKYWTKEEGFRHKVRVQSPLTSYNLIKNYNFDDESKNSLNSTDFKLIYNDLLTLEYENNHNQEYLKTRLFVYQNGNKYALIDYYHIQDENVIKFNLEFFDNIEKLIFSPFSRKYASCSIDSIDSDAKNLKVVSSNSKNSHLYARQLFKKAPMYEIEGDFKNARYFEVKFSLQPLTKKEYGLENKILKLNKENKKLNKKLKQYQSRKIVRIADKFKGLL